MLYMISAALLMLAASADEIATDCGPGDAWIRFHSIDVSPIPINLLENITMIASVHTMHEIGDNVRMSVIMKKNELEIPCTSVGLVGDAGIVFTGFMGTCQYSKACDFPFLKSWIENQNCPDFVRDQNLTCSCPLTPHNFSTSRPVTVNLAEFEDRRPSWLNTGNYTVRMKWEDINNRLVGCVDLKFAAVLPILTCPPFLRRNGLC